MPIGVPSGSVDSLGGPIRIENSPHPQWQKKEPAEQGKGYAVRGRRVKGGAACAWAGGILSNRKIVRPCALRVDLAVEGITKISGQSRAGIV